MLRRLEERFFLREPNGLTPVQNFTGVYGFSAVNSVMIKQRGPVVILGFLIFCLALAMQQASLLARSEDEATALDQLSFYRPQILTTVDGPTLLRDLPIRTLLDGRFLSAPGELGQIAVAPVTNYTTALITVAPPRRAKASEVDGKDSPDEVMAAEPNRYYYGGEVGFLYGHASGKFGGDEFSTYILGDVGNDKFQINVGASYDQWNGHNGRFRSFGFPR